MSDEVSIRIQFIYI